VDYSNELIFPRIISAWRAVAPPEHARKNCILILPFCPCRKKKQDIDWDDEFPDPNQEAEEPVKVAKVRTDPHHPPRTPHFCHYTMFSLVFVFSLSDFRMKVPLQLLPQPRRRTRKRKRRRAKKMTGVVTTTTTSILSKQL